MTLTEDQLYRAEASDACASQKHWYELSGLRMMYQYQVDAWPVVSRTRYTAWSRVVETMFENHFIPQAIGYSQEAGIPLKWLGPMGGWVLEARVEGFPLA